MKFTLSVTGTACSWYGAGNPAGSWFYPSSETGYSFSKFEHDSEPVAWDDFWASGSPWLVNGQACVRFALEAAL